MSTPTNAGSQQHAAEVLAPQPEDLEPRAEDVEKVAGGAVDQAPSSPTVVDRLAANSNETVVEDHG